jgi:hypothetical protein
MSQVICSNCFEVEDTTKRFIELPYVCALCEEDSALALEQDTYNSGVPCQSALDSVQEDLLGAKFDSSSRGYCTFVPLDESLLSKNEDATTSSLERETI